ncbi:putative ribonuclease h protein [Quercus suber]|uniref:Ribonuclease h protein n=1 Tax=Quercus suber TaxID=58331 RepID=A0AAW0KLK8_QUESU|nr:putative ribonuclease h protein [Quercus suber]
MHQFFILQVVLVGVGLLRDSNGAWVQGFSRLIGSSSVLLAELWALRDEIAMALNLNIDKLIINVDASEVINLFSKPSNTNRLAQPIVNECRSMLQAFLEYRMQHCYRETNRVADLLANIGRCQEDSLVSYVNPPFVVMEALNYDSNAVTRTIRTPIIFD